MAVRTRKRNSLILASGALLMTVSCGKKDSASDTATDATTSGAVPEEEIKASETTEVTVTDSSKLQVAGTLNLLSAKSSSTTLALADDEMDVTLSLADERKLYLRVNNDAFEAIDNASNILCFVSQTKFWEQANQGVYKVMVDESLCEHKSESSSSSDGSSSSQGQVSYMPTWVKATRAEGKPLVAEIRFDGSGGSDKGDKGGLYHAKVVVIAPPSTDYPAGIFKMTFTARKPNGDALGEHGYIAVEKGTGKKFLLSIYQGGSSERGSRVIKGSAELAKVEGSEDYTGAIRSESAEESKEGGNTYSRKSDAKVRFDEKFVNVTGKSEQSFGGQNQSASLDGCFDRNKFKTAVWRYDVVGADGKVVPLNSAFQAEFDKEGKTYFANVSYWGVWVQGDQTISNGSTIYKTVWANGSKTRTPYTISKAAGKLVKLTKSETTLSALKGVDFNMFDSGTNYIVQWNGTALEKKASVKHGDKGMEETAASGSVTIPQWGLNLWIPSLNANIRIPANATLSDAFKIYYRSEEVVSGTDGVPTGNLVCFQNCPVMAPAASAFKQSSSSSTSGPMVSALYESTTVTWPGSSASQTSNQTHTVATPLQTYTFDATTNLLKVGSTSFTLPTEFDSLSGSDAQRTYSQNVWSGALIPEADWTAATSKSTLSPFDLEFQVTTYYRWQSGASSWNQFMGVKDSNGKFVKFDKPIEINYTHATANDFDANTDTGIIGKPFRLTYAGPGQLWGIPFKYNKDVGREMPLFSLKAGTKLGSYTVYPLEGEQRMAKAATTSCSSLSLDGLPELPKEEKPEVKFTEGDKDSAVKYIAGAAVSN